jgi:hypothetical protein
MRKLLAVIAIVLFSLPIAAHAIYPAVLGTSFLSPAGTTPPGGGGKFISLHFDNAPDADDTMAASAAKTIFTNMGFTNFVVVGGAYGDNYWMYAPDSEAVFDAIWGSGNWHNADDAWAASVQAVADAWEAALDLGEDVWVAEGGQSNFSADVVAEIKSRQPALSTTTRIHIVQHNLDFNEAETDATDLAYVKAQTDYINIDDGNFENDTADLAQADTDYWKNIARNNTAHGSMWATTLAYYIPLRYEEQIDFSDSVELLHILDIPKATIDGINDFAVLYLTNPSNNFASDSNLKALYNFESGALTTDSKSTNTLTNNGASIANTDDFKQGAASAQLEHDDTQYYTRTDANLTSGFPGKNGESNKVFSLACWFKAESFSPDPALISKYNYGDNKRTYHMSVRQSSGSDYRVRAQIGYSSGTAGEEFSHGTTLSDDTWYFAVFSFDDSTKAWAIRVRDSSGAVVGTDATGTATNNIYVSDAPFAIGAMFDGATPDYVFDGLIDEVMVFSDVLTASEVTALSKGIYP